MSDTLMLSVSGCRGVLGTTLTAESAARFAGAFASVLRQRAKGRPIVVAIGRDGRKGSEVIEFAAMAALMGGGCRVVNLGVAMTPTVAIMTDLLRRRGVASNEYVAGMVITASHNPQQWIGLKCLLADETSKGADFGSAACAPPIPVADEVIRRFRSGPIDSVNWEHAGVAAEDFSGADEHVERVLGAIEDAGFIADASLIGQGLSIAIDSVNASGSGGARHLMESMGVDEVLHLGAEDTGIFPHAPEPTRENLSTPGGLCEAVIENDSDIGFAQDPDADRLAIIDEKGRYVGEEYTLALGVRALLEAERLRGVTTNGLTVVTNLSTSRMIDDVAAGFGARVLRTAVGEANVVEAMKREGSLAGGEGNGGVIWPRVAFVRDSLSAMALTMWLLSPAGGGKGKKRKLSDLISAMPAYAIEKRKVDLKRREDADPAVAAIAKHFAAERLDTQDGVRVDFTQGPWAGKAWLHVRASNTEPIMRLIAEAPNAKDANAILDLAATVIKG
jgi:phosphomannomutase